MPDDKQSKTAYRREQQQKAQERAFQKLAQKSAVARNLLNENQSLKNEVEELRKKHKTAVLEIKRIVGINETFSIEAAMFRMNLHLGFDHQELLASLQNVGLVPEQPAQVPIPVDTELDREVKKVSKSIADEVENEPANIDA